MRRILALGAALSLSACAWTNNNTAPDRLADSRRTMAPDGGPAWAIACARSVTECYDECARVCPTGYHIIDRSDEEFSSRSRAVAGDGWAAARSRSRVERISMMIQSPRAPTADRIDAGARRRRRIAAVTGRER